MFGSTFILPLFLQRLQGYSALDSGLLQRPRMLIILVTTPIAGRLYNSLDSRLLVSIGLALMMWGYLDMSGFNLETSFMRMLPGFLLTGAGMSFMFGPMSAIVMRSVPLMLLTSASSLFTLFRRIGGNLGYAFVASQVAHRTMVHCTRLVDHVTPYETTTSQVLDGLTGRLAPPAAYRPALLRTVRSSFSMGPLLAMPR